jgi:hypothetical protein
VIVKDFNHVNQFVLVRLAARHARSTCRRGERVPERLQRSVLEVERWLTVGSREEVAARNFRQVTR